MKRKTWVLAAAVSVMGWGVSQAQYRVETGNANDANNRIGSSGYNQGAAVGNRGAYAGVSANDIVYGNVTSGKEFRGNLNTTDARAFRGFTAGTASDRFIRSSASGYGPSLANQTQAFYGASRGVAPPDGTVQLPGAGGGAVASPVPQMRSGADLRLGQILDAPQIAPVRPGQLVMPGPVDNNNSLTIVTASPLYGIRTWSTGTQADQDFLGRYTDVYRGLAPDPALDNSRLMQMRDRLNVSSPLDASVPAAQPGAQPGAPGEGFSLNQPLPAALESPRNQPLTSNVNNATASANALEANIATNQSNRQRLLMQAGEQTPQLGALQKRMMEVYGQKAETDADAAREFNSRVRAMQEAEKKARDVQQRPGGDSVRPGGTAPPMPGGTTPGDAAPGAALPGGTPPGGATPGAVGTPGGINVPAPITQQQKPKPIVIKNLSSGVKVKEFAEILDGAESLMKEGKWISAIEQYDQARMVAPSNPLILIGRANANLGASYYAKAESDLRTAFTSDPSLLLGQYDLRSMLGDERIEFIVNDLKSIAKKNPNQTRPYFLLSYVHYNIGRERMAAGYLDLAEKHATPGDTFYSVVRKNWVLPEADPPVDEQNR